MKAVVYRLYGSADVLELQEIEKPGAGHGEVLVRVRAASINAWDWDLLRGKPFMNRIGGLRRPQHLVLGGDIAGEVEAVGPGVQRLRPGDAVFGDLSQSGWGGFAEYATAREDALETKSAGMSFEDAAAVPQAGMLAWQGLRDGGPIQPGWRVLINGAGGGAGSFAVQMAKSLGAEVTGVDRAEKLDMVRAIGADQVMDFTQQDFTTTGQRYDLVLDMAAYRSFFAYRRALAPGGSYLMVGGATARILQIAALGLLTSRTGSKRLRLLLYKPDRAHLAILQALIEAGTVTPVIDRRYPLSEAPEAFRYFGAGHAKGKLVITM